MPVAWDDKSQNEKDELHVRKSISLSALPDPRGLSSADGAEAASVSLKALAAAAAGGTGAVMTTLMFYPVELVKNRLQAATHDGAGFAYKGLKDGLLTIVREEGVPGLFTGLRPVVLRAMTSDFATIWFGEVLVGSWSQAALELPLRVVGGWCSVTLTLPLETLSTRVTCARPPLSAKDAALALWKEGGALAFWRGLRVMLVLCINPALTYTAFGWLRKLFFVLRSACSRPRHDDENSSSLSLPQAFGVGVAAKMLTLCAIYPLIRAKFMLQARSGGGTGLLEVLRETAVRDGFWSLYKGLDAQLSKSLLSTALMLTVKERTEVWWREVLLGRRRALAAGPKC